MCKYKKPGIYVVGISMEVIIFFIKQTALLLITGYLVPLS